MATSVRRRAGSGPGTGQWMMLGGAVLVILVLTFVLGLLVGRQWARSLATAAPPSISEAARKAATPARRSGIAAETMADRAPESTEKLTFYQTLTEPLAAQGAPPKPETKPIAVRTHSAPSPVAPPATVTPAPARAAAPEAPVPAAVSLPPTQGKTTPAATATPPWTIQLAAFKNQKQADDMRHQLASSGLEAYVANIAGPTGQARFRVRVGTFKSREDAAAAAERLRVERSLSAFVTLK
ncbi:MAG TPA: SPOR domain-containing protein [Candidatus Nitrosotalea sp.]|nr:SPOR domain-containing protein [Candidatus Nitrosotalea sp.]